MNANFYTSQINRIVSEVKKAVIGKDTVIIKTMLAMLCKGHILIEDIPGVGKTTLALAFSKALNLRHNRMQFTPDVLPSDVTGFNIYNKAKGTFEFKEGSAFCNLFLADEINRTSSKTQSALLELMEEKNITVDGITYKLPEPYTVIATQNPIGSAGTHLLPESQLDRFTIRLKMGYPDIKNEIEILKNKGSDGLKNIKSVSNANDILLLQRIAENIHVDDSIYSYMVHLADATRKHPMIKLGLSPRGTISLAAMSRACALMSGREYVIPDDVAYVFANVAEHRIILNHKARLSNLTADAVLAEILRSVPVPKMS